MKIAISSPVDRVSTSIKADECHRTRPQLPRHAEEDLDQRPSRVFIARRGRSELTTLILTGDQSLSLADKRSILVDHLDRLVVHPSKIRGPHFDPAAIEIRGSRDRYGAPIRAASSSGVQTSMPRVRARPDSGPSNVTSGQSSY